MFVSFACHRNRLSNLITYTRYVVWHSNTRARASIFYYTFIPAGTVHTWPNRLYMQMTITDSDVSFSQRAHS